MKEFQVDMQLQVLESETVKARDEKAAIAKAKEIISERQEVQYFVSVHASEVKS